MANDLLVREFDEINEERDAELQRVRAAGLPITVSTDAWTNCNGRAMMNFLACTPRGPFFLGSIDTGADRHTAHYIADETTKVIGTLGGADAVITDNAAAYAAARRMLEARHPGLVTLPCGAHALHNFLGDIFKQPVVEEVLRKAREVTATVRRKHGMLAILHQLQQQRGLRRLHPPVATRWGSQHQCLVRYLENRDALQILAATPEALMPPDTRAAVQDEQLWQRAVAVEALLRPVALLITEVEGDKPCLALLYARCLGLMQHLQDVCVKHAVLGGAVGEACQASFQLRWEGSMRHDVMLVAYMLDPCFLGEKLKEMPDDDVDAMKAATMTLVKRMAEHLCTPAPTSAAAEAASAGPTTQAVTAAAAARGPGDKAVQQLMEFWERTDRFENPERWKAAGTMDPHTWWRNWRHAAPELSRVAVLVLGLPATAAACERNWSSFKFLHSEARNRLTPERADMLVAIYWNLRQTRSRRRLVGTQDGPPHARDDPDMQWDQEVDCAASS